MPIDYRKYHPKWRLISKLVRFKRAQNKCERCTAENYKPHPVIGSKVVLTVAHLDQDVNNNRFSNLAAFCQKCHFAHDQKHNLNKIKYGKDHKSNQGRIDF